MTFINLVNLNSKFIFQNISGVFLKSRKKQSFLFCHAIFQDGAAVQNQSRFMIKSTKWTTFEKVFNGLVFKIRCLSKNPSYRDSSVHDIALTKT